MMYTNFRKSNAQSSDTVTAVVANIYPGTIYVDNCTKKIIRNSTDFSMNTLNKFKSEILEAANLV